MAFAVEIRDKKKGIFTISLDFELHWGVSDYRSVDDYRENLENTPQVVRRLLDLFEKEKIHATWATVGFLFCENKQEILRVSPKTDYQPNYEKASYSNYRLLSQIGDNESFDPFHYAPSLVKKIEKTPYQELSTHTFSHYFCLEKGQTIKDFTADLQAAAKIAEKYNRIESIIFPRNQYTTDHIEAIKKEGIRVFRGNPTSWMYRPESREKEKLLKRAGRLIDSYLTISGTHIYDLENIKNSKPYNVPASRFLRPYSQKLKVLEELRLHKIKSEMTVAAKQGKVYHLWWHPHNFGANVEENFRFLTKILTHFQDLAEKYQMVSMNMKEIADYLDYEY